MSEIKTIESISSEDLRTKAKSLGIKFTKNTSDDTLIGKIEEIENSANTIHNNNVKNSKKDLMALKLVTINPSNPLEQRLPGKFITLSNRFISITKAVQFRKPIFLEQCIIDVLKEAKYLEIEDNTRSPGKNPTARPQTRLVEAYNIVEHHTPTKEEWENDAKWKAMREQKALRDAANKEGA